MARKDYYATLGVTSNATSEEIKKAYKSLVKKWHPDVNKSEDAEARFKEIAEAYEILSDKDQRYQYDTYGHVSSENLSGFNSAFSGFSKRSKQVIVGADLSIAVTLTLEELHSGIERAYKFQREVICEDCNGTGGEDIQTCTECHGRGQIHKNISTPVGQFQTVTICHTCQGHGSIPTILCGSCQGHGTVTREEVVNVTVPKGVVNGSVYVMEGYGDAVKGGVNGNLLIRIIEASHHTFVRSKNDLKININVPYTTLVLGGKAEVKTIDETKIRVNIPPHSEVGTTLRVAGKGMSIVNSDKRGDMLINLGVIIPKTITDEERELLERLVVSE